MRKKVSYKDSVYTKHNLLFDILVKEYNLDIDYLRQEFDIKLPHSARTHFGYGVQKITLAQFEKLCELMENHEPDKVLELLCYRRKTNGVLEYVWKTLRNLRNEGKINKAKDYATNRLLTAIIEAKTFEERQEAITNAENYKFKINFKLD